MKNRYIGGEKKVRKWRELYKGNIIYVCFAFFFTFFLLCSYIFGELGGFQTAARLFATVMIALLLTPFISIVIIKISRISIQNTNKENIIDRIVSKYPIDVLILFIMHLPMFLAMYPGICYYDVSVQIEQYETPYYIQNHPLIHTLFLGYFKNIFSNANTGYAIATLIQLILVEMVMAFAVVYIYKQTESKLWSVLTLLFYGLHPVNSLLPLSTTKDIFFSICLVVFFIDLKRYFTYGNLRREEYIRLIGCGIFTLLLRNNAKHAFIPAMIIIGVSVILKKQGIKKFLIIVGSILTIATITNKVLVVYLDAVPGSIKEMMSIPAQELGRIYNMIDDEQRKEEIIEYIPNPERYNYYLSDAMKEQLPFDVLDSKCKHFLLFTFLRNLEYPIICLDAIFYSEQGYWDLFNCPYIEEHFYLVQYPDRWWGGATFDSKIEPLYEICASLFHTTENYAEQWVIIFLNIALYIWIFVFYFVKAIHEKDYATVYSCIFPLLYLATLFLGPGAIVRYVYAFYILAPVMIIESYRKRTSDEQGQ